MNARVLRLTLTVVCLTTLWTTSASAWHEVVGITSQPQQQIQMASSHDHMGCHDVFTDSCGHCCHGGAHFLALVGVSNNNTVPERQAQPFPQADRSSSAKLAPPERPPQI